MTNFNEHLLAAEKKQKNNVETIKEEHLDSITFIVNSETESKLSAFNSLTNEIFLMHEFYRTEFVVNVRSLIEISTYLEKTKPPHSDVWKRVYIVAHSSERGLTVPITNNSNKLADLKTLKGIVKSSKPKIKHINNSSIITIWACGLGNYASYLSTLKQFFKGREGSPKIRSPKLNTHFTRDENTGKASVFFAKEYYLYSPKKIKDELVKGFRKLYGSKTDWLQALNNNERIVDSNSFSEQRDRRLEIVVDRAWLKEYKTIEELISVLELDDFTLASRKLRAKQFKWSIENHQQPESVTLVGKSRKFSVFVPKKLVTKEWGRV